MILKTSRLTLRPWMESDAKYLFHFAKNPNVGPIAGWPPHENIDDSLNIIKTVFCKQHKIYKCYNCKDNANDSPMKR